MSSTPRPVKATPPAPAPLIAPTGSPGLNSVIDVVNVTAAPFQQAPPAEQGAAGWVSQGLGGVLGVIGAPAQIIDTAFASLTAPLAALFPALPACTIGALHVGMPHAHLHPPSFIPPAPPIPLPSIGMVLGSCAITVHICGLPAARAGDIGISITCGSLAPPFEIFTGSSNVFVGGSRAARMLDITQHCNPMSMGAFSVIMGAAGVVAGAAGAVATGNSYAAAQAAADAAVLVFKLLCGKDPGIPPGWGLLLGPGVPNVLIGGFPCPPIGEMAVGGLMKKLAKGMRALKARRNARRGNAHCADGSHPIYLPTGENFDHFVDFVSGGLFEWRRYVSSARAKEDGPHGYGWRHFLQRTLSVRLNRAVYTDWDGERFEFPRFRKGSDVVRADGYVLRRVERGRYRLSYRDEPVMEFAGGAFDGELPLVGLHGKSRELRLERDVLGRVCAVEEWPTAAPEERRRWELRLDAGGRIVAIDEVGVGGPGAAAVGQPVPRAWFAYDDAGNLVKAVDALGGVATYEYDSFHRVTKQTDARGYYYSFKYDVWGRCIRAGGMDGLWACRVEYFTEQGFTRYTEGDDATWEYHYEEDGFVTKIVDPYGGVKRRERDAEGKTIREIDSGGRTLRWLYDAEGAHCARVDDYGHMFPPELELARLPNPFERRLPGTAMERQFAGLMGKPPAASVLGGSLLLLGAVPLELADWVRAHFRLRPPGASPSIPEVKREKDALGRIVRETDAWGRHREWHYDATGNVVAERDRDGRVTKYQTTSWNLVGEKQDPLGNGIRYRYSSLEKVTSITDPLGNVTQYDYDLKGRLVRIHRHGRIKEEYVYDDGDHFVEKRDGEGNIIFTSEPHPNHRAGKRVLASGGIHVLDYDQRGHVTEASTEAHEVRIAYDVGGRLMMDLRDGHGVRYQDVVGSENATRQRHLFDRFVTTEELHAPGHTTVTSPAGGRTSLRWDASGMVTRHTSAGTMEIAQYDYEGRLENQVICRPGDAAWQAFSLRYAYTDEGDLVRVGDSIRGTTLYEVDAAHRLTKEVTPDGRQLPYETDATGNILTKPGLHRAEFSPGNFLAATEDEAFSFNDRNHLELRRNCDGSTTRYVYDSMDMLVRVEKAKADGTSSTVVTYAYDALRRRCTVRGAVTRDFFWEGDRLAAELLPDGRLRVYGYAGHAALVPIGFTEYEHIGASPVSGRDYFVFSNPVGMPLHIEDTTGHIVWWATRIDPYGTIEVHSESRIEYNLRWPGHYYDPDTGLHYNRHRYYDPKLGRYLQSDPLGYEGSETNLYAYPSNPLVQIDLLGLTQHDNGNAAQQPRSDAQGDAREGVGSGKKEQGDGAAGETRRSDLMSHEEADARVRTETEQRRLALAADPSVSKADVGTVVAGVIDRRTGEFFGGHNNRHGDPPERMHPIIERRVAAATADQRHPSSPGSHAEVYALNDALNAREAAGIPVTEADLGEFTMLPTWTRGSGSGNMTPGGDAPRCGNCSTITDGVRNLSGDAPEWRPPYD